MFDRGERGTGAGYVAVPSIGDMPAHRGECSFAPIADI